MESHSATHLEVSPMLDTSPMTSDNQADTINSPVMGKPKESGGKGKGKQAAAGGDENAASKGKGKSGKAADGLGTCTYVKGHVLCEKQGKINEAYKKLDEGCKSNGDKVPPAEFAKAWIPHNLV